MIATPVPLADALRRAGWGPRQLACAINVWLSAHGKPQARIDPTAPYAWVRRGYRPRTPIPWVAATVLSDELGELVTVEQLWPGRGDGTGRAVSAAHGLDQVHTMDETVQALADLAATGPSGHSTVVGANGADLTAAVLDSLRSSVQCARRSAARERVLPPQVDLIAAHVAALRRLDDRHGGGALSLRYVIGELRAVLDLARSADYERAVGHRLLTVVADLAQLSGWLYFDSGAPGPAQRYLLLSMRVAQVLGETGRAANAVGMLTYVTAFSGNGAEALRIADAAARMCPAGDPILRARIKGREATAAAAAGEASRFREASDAARELLAQRPHVEIPTYLYYLEPAQLAAEAGQGLVVLAERTAEYRARLLDEAIELLEPIAGIGQWPAYPRSALLHSTFLAEAYLRRGDTERAVAASRAAVSRLGEVQSPRGRGYLRNLRPAYARRSRNPVVAEFLPELDRALAEV